SVEAMQKRKENTMESSINCHDTNSEHHFFTAELSDNVLTSLDDYNNNSLNMKISNETSVPLSEFVTIILPQSYNYSISEIRLK
ncbi:1563_t:CDS:2, partial [Ambispora gerdemannii]